MRHPALGLDEGVVRGVVPFARRLLRRAREHLRHRVRHLRLPEPLPDRRQRFLDLAAAEAALDLHGGVGLRGGVHALLQLTLGLLLLQQPDPVLRKPQPSVRTKRRFGFEAGGSCVPGAS